MTVKNRASYNAGSDLGLDVLLQIALYRPCAIVRIICLVGDEFECRIRDAELDVSVFEKYP